MTDVVHVVGLQGVGKSMLIESMAARVEARGGKSGHILEGYGVSRDRGLGMFPGVNVVYMESLRKEDAPALPGDLVISIERA